MAQPNPNTPLPPDTAAPAPPSAAQRIRRIVQTVLLIVVPVLIYAYLFRKMGFEATIEHIRHAKGWPLVGACISSLVASVLMNSLVWQQILKAMGYRLSLSRAIYAENASLPLRMLLPAKAGEVFKGIYLKSIGLTGLGKGLSSVVFHKAVNIIALMMLSLPAVVTAQGAGARKLMILLAGLTWLYFLPGPFQSIVDRMSRPLPQRLRDAVDNMMAAFSRTPAGKKLLLLVLAVVFQAAHLVSAWLIFDSIGVSVSVGAMCAYLPAAVLVGIVPIVLYGLGTREAVFVFLFSPSIGRQPAMAAAVLFTVIQFLLPVFVGSLLTWPFMKDVLAYRNRPPTPKPAPNPL